MLITVPSLRLRVAWLSLLFIIFGVAAAQDQPLKINYHLAMPNPNTHLFEVSVEVEIPADAKIESLDFQMPKWSPGRYAVFDFAKNVQELKAFHGNCPSPKDNEAGRMTNCLAVALPITRVDDQTWRVSQITDRLTIDYKVFGNDLSGTFS